MHIEDPNIGAGIPQAVAALRTLSSISGSVIRNFTLQLLYDG
jgi:hypothetical protein